MRHLPLACTLLLTLTATPTFAGSSAQKGYAVQKGYAEPCCKPHCRKHCCDDSQRGSRSSRGADTTSRASGPVAETVSVTGLVAMPMMSFRTMSRASESRATSTCDNQDDRIEELDARVEALHLRLVTMQRSVELQTTILEELRDSGTIGGQPIGGVKPPREEEPALSEEEVAKKDLITQLQKLADSLKDKQDEPATNLSSEIQTLLGMLQDEAKQ